MSSFLYSGNHDTSPVTNMSAYICMCACNSYTCMYRWVNQKMVDGSYIFGGGFLGMDNISCVERSNPPEGTTVLQVSHIMCYITEAWDGILTC